MFLKIKPHDTFFFRSGRPFTMGAETWADVVFPPNPSTVYGAIRTLIITKCGTLSDFFDKNLDSKIKDIVGTPERKGNLKILGPFVADEEEPLFPAPADMVVSKNKNRSKSKEKDRILEPLTFLKKPGTVLSDYPLDYSLIFKKNEKIDERKVFMGIDDFQKYLLGGPGPFDFKEEIYKKEWKIGIKREIETKTAKEGYLYRIPMIRLEQDYGLLVGLEFDGDDDKSRENYIRNCIGGKGFLHLGGERKVAEYEILTKDPLEHIRDVNLGWSESGHKFFKLVLLTPAIFEKGWLPSWIESGFCGIFEDKIKLKLVAVSLKKYKLIGGWDLAKNKPKPMYRAVPEGSVYYFEVKNDSTEEDIRNAFHLKAISDDPEFRKEGFGISVVGRVGL